MALKLHIPQFNDDIYFIKSWHTKGAQTSNVYTIFGEQPVPFNAYNQVLPHRGTSDYNSGWVPFVNIGNGLQLSYRIIFTAADDTGTFDIALYSEGVYRGLRMLFNFTAGVLEHEKFLCFRLVRDAWTNNASLAAPGAYYLYISQWLGTGGIGTWNDAHNEYDYTSNGVQYNYSDFYNVTGPWIPTFPQTQETAWTKEMLPGVVMLMQPAILYNLPEVAYNDYYQSWYFGADWDPYTSLTNASGEPGEDETYDPNAGGGTSHGGGGDGDHQGNYDPIPVPPIPSIGPYSAGFIYMLNLAVGQMQQFASEIARPTMWQAFKALFADPLDFMCGVMLVPYVPSVGSAVRPMYGENSFEHVYNLVQNQYTEIDCGSIFVNKYYGSCFDHNPYHKLLLYLPYIGYREVDPDEFNGKYIHVIYHCDCMTGDCVAFIKSETGGIGPTFGRVVCQFTGNCGVRVPYGRTSFDAAIQSSIQLLGGAVGMAAGGALGVGGLAAGALTEGMIANSIQGATMMAVTGQKTGTERSGTVGASAGYLSIQKPYLLRTVQQQSLPENYISLEGYPSNVAGPLSKFSGFVGVESINLNNIAATKAEIDEIVSLLKGGVYI